MTEDHSDILARALSDFAECEEAERENRSAAEDDKRKRHQANRRAITSS